MRIWRRALIAASLVGAWPAAAAVTQSGPGGFTVTESAHISAPPNRVYAMLVIPARWWSPDHTFSHDAANLSLEPRAGGCWCERLPDGGSVEHMRVIYIAPGERLRLTGALGPLQEMPVVGVMTFVLKPADGGTDIAMTYAVGGSGLERISGAVDRVMGEQLERLKATVDTGRPQ